MKIFLKALGVLSILAVAAPVASAAQDAMGEHMGPMHHGHHGMMWHAPEGATPEDAPAPMRSYSCFSCHAVHQHLIGPAFSWIPWRYRGVDGAEEQVAAFIERGGSGRWGGTMPDLGVPADKAHAMARWILALPAEEPPAR